MSIAKPRHHQLFQSKTFEKQKDSFYKNQGDPKNLLKLHQIVLKWIESLRSGSLDDVKEVSLHGEFLNDLFRDVLGYRSLIQGKGQTWEIHAETAIADDGGSADGALGFFAVGKKGKGKLEGRIVAPIELKGAKTDLDRRTASRPESPVDQGWRYARNTDNCDWFIVSNYREIRLYHTSKNFSYYESFDLEELADLNQFRKFYFLFCRQNFLPINKAAKFSKIDELFAASTKAEVEITKELYAEYSQLRGQLFEDFAALKLNKTKYSSDVLIEKAQKLLDRVIFVCFCEDKGLIDKSNILMEAYESGKAFNSSWNNFKQVFRWIDVGNDDPPIEGYNGGLFEYDPILDEILKIDSLRCQQLARLGRYDFDSEVSVDILGHIFEQSIADLEELQRQATGVKADKKEVKNKSKRKVQGVYYTPAYITKYILEVSLGEYLERRRLEVETEDELQSLRAYLQVLQNLKVIDPACGSGAFLIAAYEYLFNEYSLINQRIAGLGGKALSADKIKRLILTNNLYGVDLSPESVGITKLSLWLHTAERKQKLENLDRNIKVGNSLVNDRKLSDRAFDWEKEFPDVFAAGGFDVAIGNPPYVRQEYISPIKPYLQKHYQSYDGAADLYAYFYEKGVQILKPDGILSYIVTNKWLRSGYGEALRRFFTQHTLFEKIIDFGHAPIFQDADTFPCIVSLRKNSLSLLAEDRTPSNSPLQGGGQELSEISPLESQEQEGSGLPPFQGGTEGGESLLSTGENSEVLICSVPREELEKINLTQYVRKNAFPVVWSRFSEKAWSLESPAVESLMQKIKSVGVPLKDFAGFKTFLGIKTGFNDAFLIDNDTKQKLVQDDPKCAEIIKPYLRGQDIKRWYSEWADLWIILVKSSANYEWAWSRSETEDEAEKILAQIYPSIYKHIKSFETQLRKRLDQGRYWWELRACVYYDYFEEEKILIQGIAFHPRFSLGIGGIYFNNSTFMLPTNDSWLIACLNSPILWYFMFRNFPHKKDEALAMDGIYVETVPIAQPTPAIRTETEEIATRLIAITKENQQRNHEVCQWIQSTHNIPKLGQKLEDFASLTQAEFVQAIRDRKPKTSGDLSPKAFKAVNEAYQEYAIPMQRDRAEANRLEHRLSDLINQAYQLTPEEIELMWRTAPPRMPISRDL
jgi:type I restriction-modification system DNA methylase subunit